MEKVNKIKQLLADAETLSTAQKRFKELISEGSVDKYCLGFNKDSRFSAGKVTISLDSKYGYFGNSDSYQFIWLKDKETFEKHLEAAIRARFSEIIQDVANRMYNEAVQLKQEAEKELRDYLEIIESLKERSNI